MAMTKQWTVLAALFLVAGATIIVDPTTNTVDSGTQVTTVGAPEISVSVHGPIVADDYFQISVQGFRVLSTPNAQKNPEARISHDTLCQSPATEDVEMENTRKATMKAPAGSGNYTVCIKFNAQFIPVLSHSLVVPPRNFTNYGHDYTSCYGRLAVSNQPYCGCYYTGGSSRSIVADETEPNLTLMVAANYSVYQGCCAASRTLMEDSPPLQPNLVTGVCSVVSWSSESYCTPKTEVGNPAGIHLLAIMFNITNIGTTNLTVELDLKHFPVTQDQDGWPVPAGNLLNLTALRPPDVDVLPHYIPLDHGFLTLTPGAVGTLAKELLLYNGTLPTPRYNAHMVQLKLGQPEYDHPSYARFSVSELLNADTRGLCD